MAVNPSGAQRRDAAQCGGCAELYAMPGNGTGGDAPHFELERHNVIEQHLEVVFRLRAMLRGERALRHSREDLLLWQRARPDE